MRFSREMVKKLLGRSKTSREADVNERVRQARAADSLTIATKELRYQNLLGLMREIINAVEANDRPALDDAIARARQRGA